MPTKRKLLDKVVREMCHYVLRLQERGIANVYRIKKSPYMSARTLPSSALFTARCLRALWEEFRALHKEHQDKLYEEARQGLTVSEARALGARKISSRSS